MTENFDIINAPQFFDFSKNCQQDEDDRFFDTYHEQESKILDSGTDPLELDELSNGGEMKNLGSFVDDYIEEQPLFRRSMSVGDLFYLEVALNNSRLSGFQDQTSREQISKSNEIIKENTTEDKRIFTKCLSKDDLKSDGTAPQRYGSIESLNRLAQPRRMFCSDECLTKPYVSMAEAVKKFQQNTPERFRTKPKLEVFQSKLERTIPHSPHLICSTRNRPVNFLSREEQEKRDFEEAQKFKIKAQPLNKKILKGPLKPTVLIEKKPSTVPEPFRLTEVHSKVVQPPKTEISKFRAQPIPDFNKEVITKSIYQKRVTKPQTPNVLKKYQKTIQQKPQSYSPQEVQKQRTKLTNTVPLPFSFQARDDAMRKRKEEFLRKVYAEEKRAREFHARPIPKAVFLASKSRNGSLNSAPVKQHSIKPRTKSEENLSTEFKAKPATVLYKKPFEPKKEERPLTEINEFVLNTDHRAKEREHFELLLKEKEERVVLLKQLDEQMRFEQEQEEIIRLRKMTEYRAQPIKKYKEFTIQPSGKITEPISPTFHYKKMTNKGLNSENKENSK